MAACFDALRGQVFGAVYTFPPRRVETLVAPALCTPTDLIAASPVRPVRVVGDATVPGVDVRLDRLPPLAGSLLALRALGVSVEPAAEPAYGRPAEAQAKWEARHGRPLPNSSR